jgi:hypothetical protein
VEAPAHARVTSMTAPAAIESWDTERPVSRALGDGLRAALVEDPVGLVLIPLVFYFPAIALEAIQSRYLSYTGEEVSRYPLVGIALSLGWAFALVGQLIGQALVIRRSARLVQHGESLPLEEELHGVFTVFPAFLVVSLLFMIAVVVGLVAFAIPAILVVMFWGFAGQVSALGGKSLFGSFHASREAVRGKLRRWIAAAALVLGTLVLLATGFGLVWAGVRDGFGDDVPIVAFVLAAGAVELVSVVFTAAWTALYLDLAGPRAHVPETPASH